MATMTKIAIASAISLTMFTGSAIAGQPEYKRAAKEADRILTLINTKDAQISCEVALRRITAEGARGSRLKGQQLRQELANDVARVVEERNLNTCMPRSAIYNVASRQAGLPINTATSTPVLGKSDAAAGGLMALLAGGGTAATAATALGVLAGGAFLASALDSDSDDKKDDQPKSNEPSEDTIF